MNVCLVSAFRNAARYVERYVAQVALLNARLRWRGDELVCIWGVGDSTDGTLQRLDEARLGTGLQRLVVNVSHGGPEYGSVVDARRFKQLAYVGNQLWAQIPADVDAVVHVESDLIWDVSTMLELLLALRGVPAVAPMVKRRAGSKAIFYDTWAARRDGIHFQNRAPYHPMLARNHAQLVQVDSMGSCLAMRGELAQGLHWPEEDVIVGVCRQINERGGSIWLHTDLAVWHE